MLVSLPCVAFVRTRRVNWPLALFVALICFSCNCSQSPQHQTQQVHHSKTTQKIRNTLVAIDSRRSGAPVWFFAHNPHNKNKIHSTRKIRNTFVAIDSRRSGAPLKFFVSRAGPDIRIGGGWHRFLVHVQVWRDMIAAQGTNKINIYIYIYNILSL